jgi:hypothetical protein
MAVRDLVFLIGMLVIATVTHVGVLAALAVAVAYLVWLRVNRSTIRNLTRLASAD